MQMYEHVAKRLTGADPFTVSVFAPGVSVKEAPVVHNDADSIVVERDGESVVFGWNNVSAIRLHDS